jgi:hypothetical protein
MNSTDLQQFRLRARPSFETKSCGHKHHVGVCPICQQAQLERWRTQLVQAEKAQRREAA